MDEIKRMYADWRGRMAADYARPKGPDPDYDAPEPMDVHEVVSKGMRIAETVGGPYDACQVALPISNQAAYVYRLVCNSPQGVTFRRIVEITGAKYAAFNAVRQLRARGMITGKFINGHKMTYYPAFRCS